MDARQGGDEFRTGPAGGYQRLVSSRVEITDLPEIGTAVREGPAWYAGPKEVSISVYSSGTTRPGYALIVQKRGEVPAGNGLATIPVKVEEEITNESILAGCSSPGEDEGQRWLAIPASDERVLELPSSRVQALRFC